MRKFRITIEDETFEVSVEEMKAARTAAAPQANIPTLGAAPARAQAAAKAAEAVVVAGPGTVCAPSPCTIFAIKCAVGDSVKVGDTLVITESMKMQTAIAAKKEGKVKDIHVQKGQFVKRGAPLVTVE